MPQVTTGSISDAVDHDAIVVGRVRIRRDRLPPRARALERLALRRERPALDVADRRLIGIDVADARAAFDRHVADRHALVHRQAIDDGAGVFVREADAALHAEASDDFEDDVLRVDAARERAVDVDAAHLQRLEREALRREHVADLRGADAEGDGAEGAVGGGVAVAAGDGHAGLGESQFGADHVDDALVVMREVVERHAEVAAVAFERAHHGLGHGVAERAGGVARGDDVIDGREGAVRVADGPAVEAELVEGLGGGHFVNEVQPDEELGLPRWQDAHGVRVPDFLQECLAHVCCLPTSRAFRVLRLAFSAAWPVMTGRIVDVSTWHLHARRALIGTRNIFALCSSHDSSWCEEAHHGGTTVDDDPAVFDD